MNPDKKGLLDRGWDLVESFCEFNGLRTPELKVVEPKDWRFSSTCAYYRPEVVTICPTRCAGIGRSGMAWSYPGYVIDRTPYGVVAHELGHHVDWTRSGRKGAYGGNYSQGLRDASGEPKLTNYCPNDWEWFAEMFRLFVTNPDLLKAIRPRTYEMLCRDHKPVETRPASVVLWDAPERTQHQAFKKMLSA